jgi:zinc/manganese transport system substrate-binding protein
VCCVRLVVVAISLDRGFARKGLIATLLFFATASTGQVLAKDINVVVSFTVLADITQRVGGDHVHVRSLVGPDGDPHVYEPTPRDAQTLAKADLVVVNGLRLEGWMDRLIIASGYKGTIAVASRGIRPREMEEGGQEMIDPHAWNSATNGIIYVSNITNALVRADPEHTMDYRTNARVYTKELRDLDAWGRRMVISIPINKRKIITSHNAFAYLGADYGIEFLAPTGLSSESEASAADLAALIRQTRREKIKAVFLENSTDSRFAEEIAAAIGTRPSGILYAEALSAPDGPAPTYEKMLRYNTEILVKAMAAN